MGGTVLVTGATGNTGAPLVENLLRDGVAVRAMVRDAGQAADRFGSGVEVVSADFDNDASLARALTGVEAAYLVTPSSERAQAQQERFVELAAEAGVHRLVKLSQLAADEASPVRYLRYHAAVERRVRELGIAYTFLRPNLFLQGLLGFAALIRDHGVLTAPIGDAKVSAVDVRDIAAVAAVALTRPGHENTTYTLTSPEAVTHARIAEALATATGREVRFVDATPEEFAGQLRGLLPDWQAEGLVEDYAHYSRGEAAEVTTAIEDVTGSPARALEDFARDYAPAFR